MPFTAKVLVPCRSGPDAEHRAFDAAALGRVTVFDAPVGYVLTEGLAAALGRVGRNPLWVRLGPEDRDPATFLLSMITAARRSLPNAGRATLELMRVHPGPVTGWPPLFDALAAELSAQLTEGGALVIANVHHLRNPRPTLALVGANLLPAVAAGGVPCVLIGHRAIPRSALRCDSVRRSVPELQIPAAAVERAIDDGTSGLTRHARHRMLSLCGGRAAVLAALRTTQNVLGRQAVERSLDRAFSVEHLLALLAEALLDPVDDESRRALGLAGRIEYTHPDLTAAVLSGGDLLSGPWLQRLEDGWARVRTIWHRPLQASLGQSALPGRDALHRAADQLLERGAVEHAVALYMELHEEECAARAISDGADNLMDLGQWDTLNGWLKRLPEDVLAAHPELVHRRAEIAAVRGDASAALRSFDLAASGFATSNADGMTHLTTPRVSALPTLEGKRANGDPGTASGLAVRLLGALCVAVDGIPVERWSNGRARSLFAYLLTHREPWPQREMLMAVLWPNSTTEAARNSLNVAIHSLRCSLRTATASPVIMLTDTAYHLHPDLRLWLDVEESDRRLEHGRRLEEAGESDAAVEEYEFAAGLHRGDFLAENPYEDWALPVRGRLRMVHLDALDRLSNLYFGSARYAACAALCHRIIERDPCREDAHRRLMRCYNRQGQPHLALFQYRECARVLAEELSIQPSPATIELQDQIRRHEPI